MISTIKYRILTSAAILLGSSLLAGAAEYTLNVADFNALTVDNGVNVTYKCLPDSAGIVAFECEPELASKILLLNNKSNLRIQLDIDEGIPSNLPVVRVYSTGLNSVCNSGDSTVVVTLSHPVDKFTAKVIGNGAVHVHNLDARQAEGKVTAGRGFIHIDGKADKAKLFIAGTGRIDAGNLQSREVRSSSIGPGHIICNPSKKLSVGGLSGHIYYMTEPEEISRRGMGVKALPIDSLP